MLPHHRLFTLLKDVEYTVVTDTSKRNKGIEYVNLACAFDTETTSMRYEGEKGSFVYIWMLGIGNGENVYYGRTLDDLVEACEFLSRHFKLGKKRRLPIYVHNLGYDFEFIRRHFEWEVTGSFATGKGSPLKMLTKSGIEFRDSYILSGMSLALTTRNLTKYKQEKMVGDLDYDLIRTSETPLTEKEMGYCKADITVTTAYIQEQIEYYGDVLSIPMTNTGRVRNLMKQNCFYQGKEDENGNRKRGGGQSSKFRALMKSMTLDVETYQMLKNAFAGGFTHANKNKAGQVHENVSSIDFTSSYPAVMVSEQFPMTRFFPYEFKSTEDFEEKIQTKAVLMTVRFTNLYAITAQESYISESKCVVKKDTVVNNGRIDSASEVVIEITEVDYRIIKHVYSFDTFEVIRAKIAGKNYLPKPVIKTIFELYEKKTVLKDVEGYEAEYTLSKGMLNSVYGMSVTDFVHESVVYDPNSEEWMTGAGDVEGEVEAYNKNPNRFLYYAWGVWVTAYARLNLWDGIIEMGDDYIYSDTDSIKFTNYDNHVDYINSYNDLITAKIKTMAETTGIDLTEDQLIPKTQQGVAKPLGVWDFEGTYSRFKTLGAKRYLVEKKGKLAITIAGLSKANGLQYMIEQCDGDHTKVFDMFDNQLTIPAESTGKQNHTILDNTERAFKVTDYCGAESIVKVTSGVHLEPTPFTLSMADEYINLLEGLKEGQQLRDIRR